MKEPKLKTVYVCSNCGETSPRWMGRCPSCGSWNTMNEDVVAEAPKAGLTGGKAAAPVRQEGVTSLTAKRLADISTTEEKSRILTGISELDRVLGGGIVLGGVVLIRGYEPLDIVRLPVPEGFFYAVVHPDIVVSTKEAREVLPREVPLHLSLIHISEPTRH